MNENATWTKESEKRLKEESEAIESLINQFSDLAFTPKSERLKFPEMYNKGTKRYKDLKHIPKHPKHKKPRNYIAQCTGKKESEIDDWKRRKTIDRIDYLFFNDNLEYEKNIFSAIRISAIEYSKLISKFFPCGSNYQPLFKCTRCGNYKNKGDNRPFYVVDKILIENNIKDTGKFFNACYGNNYRVYTYESPEEVFGI